MLLIYPEEFLRKFISSKKEPNVCILTFSKNFVILATFSGTTVKSALLVSTGTFSDSSFLYENSNSYTRFQIESKFFLHCPEILGTVAKTALHLRMQRKFFWEMKSTEVSLGSQRNSNIERTTFHSVVKTVLYMFRLTFSGGSNLSKNLNLQLNSKVEKIFFWYRVQNWTSVLQIKF